jgi:UMP-CMP kinase
MSSNVQFISVLGRPGSGKGTQCALLKERFQCGHISVGDLLRNEADNPESPYAEVLQDNLKNGKIGTKEMTVGIVKKKVDEFIKEDVRIIFLDGTNPFFPPPPSPVPTYCEADFGDTGFPRKLDTAKYFEKEVGPIHAFVMLLCDVPNIEKRLLKRGRADDDVETIRKRIVVYEDTTYEVVQYFTKEDRYILNTCAFTDDAEAIHRYIVEELKGFCGVQLVKR